MYSAGSKINGWMGRLGKGASDFEEGSRGAGPEARLSSPHPSLADSVEDEFELSTVCHRPEGLEQLQEQTKFTRKELQVLYRGFKNVSLWGAARLDGGGVSGWGCVEEDRLMSRGEARPPFVP